MDLPNPQTQPAASSPIAVGAPVQEPAASPEELLEAYAQGDEEAFERLVDGVGDRLFAVVLRMLADYNRAEDVYQNILVKVATKAHLYERRASALSWLFQVARNACLDALRKEGRRPEVSLDAAVSSASETPLANLVEGNGPDPAAPAADRELGQAIAKAVAVLPDEQREVFLLKEEGELTFEEIGELLGVGKETAKSRMRYALERLRNALGREARIYGLQ